MVLKYGIKENLQEYVPSVFEVENEVFSQRTIPLQSEGICKGPVIYLMQSALRIQDNFALNFALQKAKEHKRKVKIIHIENNFEQEHKRTIYSKELMSLQKECRKFKLHFEILKKNNDMFWLYLKRLKKSFIISDKYIPENKRKLYLKKCNVFFVDAFNIIPCPGICENKSYSNLCRFLTEFPRNFEYKTEAYRVMENFIRKYFKNQTVRKSKSLKLAYNELLLFIDIGLLSVQRLILNIIKSGASQNMTASFIEDII